MSELTSEDPEPTDVGATALHYDSIAALEQDRLRMHPIERELTLDTILTHLGLQSSSSNLKIADIGGATGAYAFRLADIAAGSPAGGIELHLRDISTSLLALAEREQERRIQERNSLGLLASIEPGSALDTALFPDSERGTFDAVLLLGPPYHLVQKSERVRALKNALSLLRPVGADGRAPVVFAAFVSRHAHLRDIAMREPGRLVTDSEFYRRYLATGAYVRTGPTRSSYHVASPGEICSLVEEAGGRVVELVGVEGILGGGLDAKLVDADEEVLKAWVRVLRDFARGESNLGAADHWLAVIAPRG